MNVFTADLKDDKKKLIEDAVAELKNAGGDGPATKAAASPKKEPEKPKKVEKPKVEAKKKPAAGAKKPAKKAVKKAEPTDDGPPKLGSPLFFIFLVAISTSHLQSKLGIR